MRDVLEAANHRNFCDPTNPCLAEKTVTGGQAFEQRDRVCDRAATGNCGISVWLGCRDPDFGEQAAAKIRNEGLAAKAVRLDVTDDGSVREAVRQLKTEAAALYVLLNMPD